MSHEDSATNNNTKNRNWFKRITRTRGFEILSTFIKSAAVGLLFAVLCFVYDIYHDSEQDKQLEASIEKLANIEQSLSTRYLGIFPEYITEIGALFSDLKPTDSVVIFEDVLYYGIKSRPKEFYNYNTQLFEHAIRQGSITVAYYNFRKEERSSIFHKMMIESRIDPKYHPIMMQRRREEMARLMNDTLIGNNNREIYRKVDSMICEEYFAATRNDDPEKFRKDIESYLRKDLITRENTINTPAELVTYEMCVQIDSVKNHYLGNGKPVDSILFSDYEQMYRVISGIIAKYYSKYDMDLIPLDDYLTMSCWMVQKGEQRGVKTVLAFPSKYSSDEIGFYSQDEAFSKYIGTMLDGVRQSRLNGERD